MTKKGLSFRSKCVNGIFGFRYWLLPTKWQKAAIVFNWIAFFCTLNIPFSLRAIVIFPLEFRFISFWMDTEHDPKEYCKCAEIDEKSAMRNVKSEGEKSEKWIENEAFLFTLSFPVFLSVDTEFHCACRYKIIYWPWHNATTVVSFLDHDLRHAFETINRH